MPELNNKSRDLAVWITGASSGLGEALAHDYAKHGARVYLSARSEQKLADVNSALARPGEIHPCDVTDDYQLTTAVNKVVAASDGLDIAILNAGTYQPVKLVDLNSEDARALFEINFFSVVRTIELLVPHMVARGRGHIAVVASVAGDVGLPYASIYSASKSALNRLCESLQPELAAQGIGISVVNPGFVKTPLTDKNDFPMPFLISADEAAGVIRRGIEKKRFEIRFPFLMGFLMRRLSRLPKSWLLKLTRRMLKDDDPA